MSSSHRSPNSRSTSRDRERRYRDSDRDRSYRDSDRDRAQDSTSRLCCINRCTDSTDSAGCERPAEPVDVKHPRESQICAPAFQFVDCIWGGIFGCACLEQTETGTGTGTVFSAFLFYAPILKLAELVVDLFVMLLVFICLFVCCRLLCRQAFSQGTQHLLKRRCQLLQMEVANGDSALGGHLP